MKSRVWVPFAFVLVFAALAGTFAVARDKPLLIDENMHFAQIQKFYSKDFTPVPNLAMTRGYHAVIAAFARVAGRPTPSFVRLVSFAAALAVFFIFFLCARTLAPGEEALRTLQFIACPLVLPFTFLIYTDLFSLGFVLAVFWAVRRREYAAAGVLGLAALVARQTNVIWILFMIVWSFLDERKAGHFDFREWAAHARKTAWLWADVVLFGVFVVWNRGVAVGDRSVHPLAVLSAQGLVFGLAAFGFLAAPLAVDHGAVLLRRLKAYPLVLCVWPLLWIAFAAGVKHPYNFFSQIQGVWVLRNLVLAAVSNHILWLVCYTGLAFWGALILWAMPLGRRADYIWLPISAVFLVLHWLVEPRYLIPPIAFWMLFRKKGSRLAETLLFLFWLTSAVWITIGVIDRRWIP